MGLRINECKMRKMCLRKRENNRRTDGRGDSVALNINKDAITLTGLDWGSGQAPSWLQARAEWRCVSCCDGRPTLSRQEIDITLAAIPYYTEYLNFRSPKKTGQDAKEKHPKPWAPYSGPFLWRGLLCRSPKE